MTTFLWGFLAFTAAVTILIQQSAYVCYMKSLKSGHFGNNFRITLIFFCSRLEDFYLFVSILLIFAVAIKPEELPELNVIRLQQESHRL
jgi:hypothetical protein